MPNAGSKFTSIYRILGDEEASSTGVIRFTDAMLEKLDRKRRQGNSGWNDPKECSVEFLKKLLEDHKKKNNPENLIDIANLCMMIWNRQNPRGLKK